MIDISVPALRNRLITERRELWKVIGTSAGLRHVLGYVGQRRLKAKIPYAPGDEKLVAHIEEILAQPQVDCGDYVGERLITDGNTNSIQ